MRGPAGGANSAVLVAAADRAPSLLHFPARPGRVVGVWLGYTGLGTLLHDTMASYWHTCEQWRERLGESAAAPPASLAGSPGPTRSRDGKQITNTAANGM
jgi:hypothetical protein